MRVFAVAAAVVFLAIFTHRWGEPGFAVTQFTLVRVSDGEDWHSHRTRRVINVSAGRLNEIGCVIDPSADAPFQYYTVHFLPGVPKHLGDGWAKAYKPEDAPRGLRSKVNTAQGRTVVSWLLEDGDPLGEYRIEVYVNDKRVEDLEFLVQPDSVSNDAA